jgi:hypothetical protein
MDQNKELVPDNLWEKKIVEATKNKQLELFYISIVVYLKRTLDMGIFHRTDVSTKGGASPKDSITCLN